MDSTIENHEVDHFMRTAEKHAREAGILVREAFSVKNKVIEEKSCAADLVTETDKKVEDLLISALKTAYPTHRFIGEETTAEGESCNLTSLPTWIIDPVDGTMNFVHSFPFVAICIGLSIGRKLVAGLVYNPIQEEMYRAIKGKGAFLNDQPIRTSGVKDFKKSLLITEVGYNTEVTLDLKMNNYKSLLLAGARGFRSLGSAALNMCQVARGSAELYYEYGIHCWDMAASSVIVTEAGGVVKDPTGDPLDIMSRRCVAASSAEVIEEFIKHVKHLELDRDDRPRD